MHYDAVYALHFSMFFMQELALFYFAGYVIWTAASFLYLMQVL